MTAQEIEERDKRTTTRLMMEALEEDLFIDPNEEIDHPPVCLSFGEHKIGAKVYPTPIATYGNLIMVQAPPKSMKTFFTSLLSAAYLADSVEGVTGKNRGGSAGTAQSLLPCSRRPGITLPLPHSPEARRSAEPAP